MLQAVHRVITRLLGQAGLKADEAGSGAVTLIQRFGSAANLNIHLHCLVLDGVYRTGADRVSKYARDGSLVATYPTGQFPWLLLFDGTHIWVGNRVGRSVTKLRASDGALIGTFTLQQEPSALVFDGISVWVASAQSNALSRL